MKTKIILIITLLFIYIFTIKGNEADSGGNSSRNESIKVFTSEGLFSLATKWTTEYRNLNPDLSFEVIQTSETNIKDLFAGNSGIVFTTDDSYAALSNQSVWSVVVGHDVIVPVMNAKNPIWEEIIQKGISHEELKQIVYNPDNRNWGNLTGNSQNTPLHFFVANDPAVISGLGNFLDSGNLLSAEIQSISLAEMIATIRNDPYALGFCKLVDITNQENQEIASELKLVPIDKNGNGKIDYMENIYQNLSTFSRGVWIGKYPKVLSASIYSVLAEKPQNAQEVEFLKWILADGQQFLSLNGYSDLVYAEKQSQLAKIDDQPVYADIPVQSTNTILGLLLLILFVIIAISVVLDLLFRMKRNQKPVLEHSAFDADSIFDADSVSIPQGIYFDKTHTWAFRRKNGSVKVGVDDFMQHVTGKITRVEMKETGTQVKKGELLLSIVRNGKLLNIYSPVSGKIIGKNKNLIENSSLINSSPYTEGWVYLVDPTNWELEIKYLSLAEKYKTWVKGEFSRLKDFFATAIKNSSPEFATVILQDGGTVKNHVLADLGPEIWEDFQTKFIDTAK
jgi:glycine cleavage system H lipoate-binding protein/ABC-type phosphate transport system substrate-binding protein